MTAQTTPTFRELDRAECDLVLARNAVGRIAFSLHDRVDIEPIHYVYADGWIYCRTSAGTKLATIAHNRWIAFEVDEVQSAFDWRSVVVHGSVSVIAPDVPAGRHGPRALELLRGLIPQTLDAGDPVPFRDVLLGVHVDTVRGRAASSTP